MLLAADYERIWEGRGAFYDASINSRAGFVIFLIKFYPSFFNGNARTRTRVHMK
jgi:hypothetical protein